MTRETVQKKAILEAVRGTASHPTADWVYGEVREELPHISLGTVYRNLRQLVERGEVSEVEINGSAHRYDRRTDVHHHFICQGCGQLWDLDEPADRELTERIAREAGFKVSSYRTMFNGLCGECQGSEKQDKGDGS